MAQFKTLVSTSFPVIQLEFEEAKDQGWKLDKDNLPVCNMFYYEIFLIKEDNSNVAELKEELFPPLVMQEAEKRKPGRPVKSVI